MEIAVLTHVPFEGPAAIAAWAESRGHRLNVVHLYRGDVIPATFDWLIIMGGPMGAMDDERYPWFRAEKQAIGQSIRSGRTVVGICLGAQLIAAVPGARVFRNAEREIGWFGRVLGLQFHLEANRESIESLMRECPADLLPGTFVQTKEAILSQMPEHTTLFALLDALDNQHA